MRCPTLAELPPPPPGKTGWPWTVETPRLPPARPDGSPWPRISIVTPSYHQGRFIEETIRSVLLQGYPDLEYIIIDGGSTDHSVDIIQKYEPWLAYWVSEKDRGQSHAINKGFKRSTGTVLSWLNSDDVLLTGAIGSAGMATDGAGEALLVAGFSEYRDISGTKSVWVVDRLPSSFGEIFSFFSSHFAQPSVFITREALAVSGGLREDLHYAMDLDLWLRVAERSRITLIKQHLSWMRQHANAKTWRDGFGVLEEVEKVLRSHSRKVKSKIVRQTYASARAARSRIWMESGFNSIRNGDRRNALICAYRAIQTRVLTSATRSWIILILEITLPRLFVNSFRRRRLALRTGAKN